MFCKVRCNLVAHVTQKAGLAENCEVTCDRGCCCARDLMEGFCHSDQPSFRFHKRVSDELFPEQSQSADAPV